MQPKSTYKFHPLEFDLLNDSCRGNISISDHGKFLFHSKKLTNLITQQQSDERMNESVINSYFDNNLTIYTSITITEKENELLAEGPEFEPYKTDKKKLETVISEFDLKNE